MYTGNKWRFLAVSAVCATALMVNSAYAACVLDGRWEMTVDAVNNGDGSVTFTICVTGSGASQTCDLSHFSLNNPGDTSGGACGTIDPSRTDNPGCWGFGQDPSSTECNGGENVWKYDCPIPADGTEHCIRLTLFGVFIDCGTGIIKGGNGCESFSDVPVPSCDPASQPCPEGPPPPEPCDPSAVAFSLTQGAYGSARHFEALACEIIATCPSVAADIATVASCYGYQAGQDLGDWVTGNCGTDPQGPDGGFLPSGFGPGQNGGSQLIAALLNVGGIACYGLDAVGGDPVGAIGRDWIILSTGQTVGEVLDAAMATCGAGFAGILGEINESWDEGFDQGTVSPCPGL